MPAPTSTRSALSALIAVFLVVAASWSLSALPAGAMPAGDAPATTSATTEAPPAPNIIPRPNSGAAPTDAGDRGGALQTAIFVLVLAGTGGMAVLVWRQSKKAREERGF